MALPRKVKDNRSQCTSCKEWFPLTEEFFYPTKRGPFFLTADCKTCNNKKSAVRRLDPQFVEEQRQYLKEYYWGEGVQTLYLELFEAQKGLCAICNQPESRKGKLSKKVYDLSIDHDHKTGAIRGLLCHDCNLFLGLLEKNVHRLEKSLEYLNRQPVSHAKRVRA